MSKIADSDSILDIRRILPQHQAALTLLNGKLQNPSLTRLDWLDLACGKGQIISQLNENLSIEHRGRLHYIGYDINPMDTKTAERIADGLQLASYNFQHGDLANFNSILKPDKKFDFITCTNTAHELQPGAFASLILNAFYLLTDNGEFFIYDMESLSKPELGALPWRGAEIQKLLNTIFETIGTKFKVQPSVWTHSTCKGWSITIQRNYVSERNDYIFGLQNSLASNTESIIDEILDNRLKECNKALDTFCRFGTESVDDAHDKTLSLYEYWAINRSMEMRKK